MPKIRNLLLAIVLEDDCFECEGSHSVVEWAESKKMSLKIGIGRNWTVFIRFTSGPVPTFKRIIAKWVSLLDVDDYDESNLHSKRICILISKVCDAQFTRASNLFFRSKVYWVPPSKSRVDSYFSERRKKNELISEDNNDANCLLRQIMAKDRRREVVLETLFEFNTLMIRMTNLGRSFEFKYPFIEQKKISNWHERILKEDH
ncbi:hypothetical protein Tco_0559625 [Tanacetum coccineum]